MSGLPYLVVGCAPCASDCTRPDMRTCRLVSDHTDLATAQIMARGLGQAARFGTLFLIFGREAAPAAVRRQLVRRKA